MKLLAIGPLPKQNAVTGLAIAFEMAARGLEGVGFTVETVDTMPSSVEHVSGRFRWQRLAEILRVLWVARRATQECDLVYFTISTSTLGMFKDLCVGLIAKAYAKPVVGHLHGGGEANFYQTSGPFRRFLIRASRRLLSRIIVLGNTFSDEFSYLNPPADVVVVPNGLPVESEPREYVPKELSREGVVSLLFLSNMMPSKGYLALLDACEILKRRGVRFTCTYCGAFVDAVIDERCENSSRAFLDRVDAAGLADEVQYLGVVRGRRKRAVLADAHIFVLPTTYAWEGQPISIIEAMSWGIPVVATRHKGIPEQVQDGASGVLIESPDPSAIADAVVEVIDGSRGYADYSRCARLLYEERFTQKAFVENLRESLKTARDRYG